MITDRLFCAGKFDALTDINALANFGLRGVVHHGRGRGGVEALIKRRTINPPRNTLNTGMVNLNQIYVVEDN